jgi:CheY-like chemotaxis protein
MQRNAAMNQREIEILLVEDNPGDARLTIEALKEAPVRTRLNHVADGVEALAFVRRQGRHAQAPRPGLILLDLNLPRKDGREVLAELKADHDLKRIPIIVLTTSQADEDILRAYNLNANCYVSKPMDLDQFTRVIRCIEEFWLTVAQLPTE